ncbi:MAG: hypothetical protein CMI31_15255 [Opitutae bacterium]|nr:hypothetical protein [Opitutae bacterium]|tara:strand:- start:1514 stop:2374 length:861 start_codon:yes stop_codon:yes gene_type:complete
MLRFPSFLVTCLCLIASSASADDKDALAAIEKLGGAVRGIAQNTEGIEIDFHLRGDVLTDAGLLHLARLQNVVILHLAGTEVTDAGLVHLKGLSSLRRLHLEKTGVGDTGLAHLKGLGNLEYLNLYGTKVSDKGLDHLVGLMKLKRLYLWQSQVTEDGAEKLRKALPGLEVNTGADLSTLVTIAPSAPVKLVDVKWVPASTVSPPRSRNGQNVTIQFENKSGKKVKVFWISFDGNRQLYAELANGATRKQNSYGAHTWLITDEKDAALGHFICAGQPCKAVIPALK